MFASEREFETYIRALVATHITPCNPTIYPLKNKKAVDILICKDSPIPELFFIEVKFHQSKHGRLGFGGSKGGGFQPEIVQRKPAYFETHLRWVLASEDHEPGKVLFIDSDVVRKYLAGGAVSEKFNNFQKKIFREGVWLSEQELIQELRSWLGAVAAQPSLQADVLTHAA